MLLMVLMWCCGSGSTISVAVANGDDVADGEDDEKVEEEAEEWLDFCELLSV